MPSVKITNLETLMGDTDTTLFDPFGDPISLRISVSISADAMQVTNPKIRYIYQIINFSNNEVFETWQSTYDLLYLDAAAWIGLPTAHDLGMNWTASDIFGFRGAVELFSNQEENGLVAIDAMDVAGIHWFRVKDLFLV
jgi:hypothetical protein